MQPRYAFWLNATEDMFNTNQAALTNIALRVLSAGIPVIFLPIYYRELGQYQYGLYVYLLAVQGISFVLDFGISTIISHYFADKNTDSSKLFFFGICEVIYTFIGAFASLLIYVYVEKFSGIGPSASEFYGVSVALYIFFAWNSSYYSGCLIGLQKQAKLNFMNVFGAILRFGGGLLAYKISEKGLVGLIFFQTLVNFFISYAQRKLVINSINCYDKTIDKNEKKSIYKKYIKFTGMSSIILMLYVAFTQYDKISFTEFFGIEDYAIYSLACVVPAAIVVVSHPLVQTYFPLFVKINNSDERSGDCLFQCLKLVCMLLIAPAGIFLCNLDSVFELWTGHAATERYMIFSFILTLGALTQSVSGVFYSYLTAKIKNLTIIYAYSTQVLILVACVLASNFFKNQYVIPTGVLLGSISGLLVVLFAINEIENLLQKFLRVMTPALIICGLGTLLALYTKSVFSERIVNILISIPISILCVVAYRKSANVIKSL